jgi:hypothetical protein
MRMQPADKNAKPVPMRRSQYGAALILIMFMLGMGVVAFMLKSVNSGSFEFQQQEKTTLALNEAKEALIAWSASHPNWPGILPFPDRKETSSPPNYDGKSDCVTSGLNFSHLIGMLPVGSESPCVAPQTGLSLQSYGVVKTCANSATSCDETGTRLWYAVSMNLIRTSSLSGTTPIINPGIIDNPLIVPWMRVLDRNGNLISDRVAAVIIAPGAPLANQDRSGLPDAADYLDSLQIGATVYSNSDYDTADEDFIMAPDSTRHSAVDVTYQSPYYFNDRLVYITIDELIAAVEKRVATEVESALKHYKNTYATFPYAAPLGSSKNYSCVNNQSTGLLPIDSAKGTSCSCTSNLSCNCNFSEIQRVVIDPIDPSQNWETATGSCSIDNGNCSCTGSGACSLCNGMGCLMGLGIKTVTCNGSSGNCSSPDIPGIFTYYNVFTNSDVNVVDGDCTYACGSTTVTCNGTGSFSNQACADPGIAPKISSMIGAGDNDLTSVGTNLTTQNIVPGMYVTGTGIQDDTTVSAVTGTNTLSMSKNATATGTFNDIRISRLKKWFFDNGWQNYVYYAMTKGAPTLTVGAKSGVEALLVTTGKAITSPFTESKNTAQTRISCNVNDYLDSTENTNLDLIYDAGNKARKQNYNDQVFIVAP